MAAMIDLGPDELFYALQQEFYDRKRSLFRHPLNMRNEEIYYLPPPLGLELFEKYPWNREDSVKGTKPFRTLQSLAN